MRRDTLMHRFFKDNAIYRIALSFMFLAFIIVANPAVGSPRSAPKSLDRSGNVTISGKTADAVLISERHFLVTESTIILDVRGKKIQLSDLPVPCDAEIEYRLSMDQDPVTLKITIKQLLKGSSKTWPPPRSEG